MNSVFISYVRENKEAVDRLHDALTSWGIDVWIDWRRLEPGDLWKHKIRQAIQKGAFFIPCFSQEYNNRVDTYMNQELDVAIEVLKERSFDQKWCIPVKLNECEIPDHTIGRGETLRSFQYVDLSENWDMGIQRIREVIQSELSTQVPDTTGVSQVSEEAMETETEHKASSQQADLDEVLEKINEIERKSANGDYIYRGETSYHEEPPYNGRITSGLYRQYLDIRAEHFDIAVVQEEILKEAKEYTHQTNEFEILTELQHYGGKTNLIDFTADFHVALFFACDGNSDKPGRVILIQKQSETYEVIPAPRTFSRAGVHKSIFVQSPSGFVEPDTVVYIPADLKRDMLDYLRKHHDISTKTIYNDLLGFIEKRRIHKSLYTEFYKALTCQDRGDSTEDPAEKQKWYDKAIAHYNTVIDWNPEHAVPYNNRGNAYLDKGEFDAALRDFNTAIKWNPEDVDAYNNRGAAYNQKGEFDKAIQDYNTAIKWNPEDADAYNNRGAAYNKKGEFQRAIQDFSTAIELNPEDAGFYNNRGIVYSNIGKIDRAIQDFGTAIELNPEHADAYYNRGGVWLHLSEWEKAKADLSTPKEMGINIVASSQNAYESVEDFEAKNRVKLPEDIAALLQ